jgi:hypothetical protein
MTDSIIRAMSGTYGEVQIVASPDQVLVDLSGRHYNSTGHLMTDHGLVQLDLAQAVQLLSNLQAAVEVARLPRKQQLPKIWSERTIAEVAARVGGRQYVHNPSRNRRFERKVKERA